MSIIEKHRKMLSIKLKVCNLLDKIYNSNIYDFNIINNLQCLYEYNYIHYSKSQNDLYTSNLLDLKILLIYVICNKNDNAELKQLVTDINNIFIFRIFKIYESTEIYDNYIKSQDTINIYEYIQYIISDIFNEYIDYYNKFEDEHFIKKMLIKKLYFEFVTEPEKNAVNHITSLAPYLEICYKIEKLNLIDYDYDYNYLFKFAETLLFYDKDYKSTYFADIVKIFDKETKECINNIENKNIKINFYNNIFSYNISIYKHKIYDILYYNIFKDFYSININNDPILFLNILEKVKNVFKPLLLHKYKYFFKGLEDLIIYYRENIEESMVFSIIDNKIIKYCKFIINKKIERKYLKYKNKYLKNKIY